MTATIIPAGTALLVCKIGKTKWKAYLTKENIPVPAKVEVAKCLLEMPMFAGSDTGYTHYRSFVYRGFKVAVHHELLTQFAAEMTAQEEAIMWRQIEKANPPK